MNNWTAVGNVGRDCELRVTKSGDNVASWSMTYKQGFGDNAKTQWVNCSLFGKRAEKIAPHILSGNQLAIQGEIFVREWTDKEGKTKSNLECVVANLTFVGKKPDGNKASSNEHQEQQEHTNEDIPF